VAQSFEIREPAKAIWGEIQSDGRFHDLLATGLTDLPPSFCGGEWSAPSIDGIHRLTPYFRSPLAVGVQPHP
jgi:hypothetical protein